MNTDAKISFVKKAFCVSVSIFAGVYFTVCTAILKAAKELNYLPGAFIMSLCVDDPNFLNTVGVDNERYVIGPVQWNVSTHYM